MEETPEVESTRFEGKFVRSTQNTKYTWALQDNDGNETPIRDLRLTMAADGVTPRGINVDDQVEVLGILKDGVIQATTIHAKS